ncbi:MAG: twin-arginine translocation signal domain-containing protein [Candidatus Shapirobacteria bacterium]|jgi:hypothetical protein
MSIDRRGFLRATALATAGAVLAQPPHYTEILTVGDINMIHDRENHWAGTDNIGKATSNSVLATGWPEKLLELSQSIGSRLEKTIVRFHQNHPNTAFIHSYLGPTLPYSWNLGKPLSYTKGDINIIAHSVGAASLSLAASGCQLEWLNRVKTVTLVCPAISLDVISPSINRLGGLVNYPTTSQSLDAYYLFIKKGISFTIITAPNDGLVNSERVTKAFGDRFGDKVTFLQKTIDCHGLSTQELDRLFI